METDRQNSTHTIFSGGSRVLAEGKLSPTALKRAAMLAAGLTLVSSLVLALFFSRYIALLLAIIGLGLLYMYSFAPFRISYRGGGELLQTAGVGIVLPLYGYYGQKGLMTGFPWEMLAVILPTELACAMATALPDEPSDRQSEKRTAAVRFGDKWVKAIIMVLNTGSIIAFILLLPHRLEVDTAVWLLAVPVLATLSLSFTFRGKPGERQLALFVGTAIASTLFLMGALSALPIVMG